jgi:CDP-diacylglycerol--glycerol-3-phosphate 3-phosphatidyltransferase/cardiolipin synthase
VKLFTIPNILSLARLPLAAAFVLADTTGARIAIVAAVAVSDLADGYLARHIRSHDRRAGQIIDPITDKLFVLIALIAFAVRRDITVGTLLLLISRDLYTSFAFFILQLLHWRIQFRSRLSGKAVTVFQIATLFALLFWRRAVRTLVWVTVVASAFAIFDYTRAALRQRRELAGAAVDA